MSFPDEVVAALADHQSGRLVGVASYQGALREFDVSTDGSVSYRANGEVQGDAAIVAYGHGDSMVPKSRADFLAPYGQEVSLFRELVLRDQTWRIPLGLFRVTGWSDAFEDVISREASVVFNPSGLAEVEDGLFSSSGLTESSDGEFAPSASFSEVTDGLYSFPSQSRTIPGFAKRVLSWSVAVDLADRFRMLQRAHLVDRKSPPAGATIYGEIRRLAPMPIQVNPAIGDVSVPADLAYEGGRLAAIRDLADLANAVPHMTRGGVLTLRVKDAWAEPDLEPVFDIDGTIEWGDGETDEFYNFVRVSDPDEQYVAYALELDDSNPLSVGRAGESHYEHVSPAYTSYSAAQAGANTILRRVMNRRSKVVTVACAPVGLLLELGDVGWFRDPVQGRAVLGEVIGLDFPNDVTEPVRVSVVVAEAA